MKREINNGGISTMWRYEFRQTDGILNSLIKITKLAKLVSFCQGQVVPLLSDGAVLEGKVLFQGSTLRMAPGSVFTTLHFLCN
jgi:hypothetical protein